MVYCSSLKLLSCILLLRGKIELGFLSSSEAWGHCCERIGELFPGRGTLLRWGALGGWYLEDSRGVCLHQETCKCLEQAHTAQGSIQWCRTRLQRETWGCSKSKTLGTAPATRVPSSAVTALLLGLCVPACPLAGKNLLSTWHCNMLHLRQNMPSRPTHSSFISTTEPPLALVYTGAQGLQHPGPSTFLSASQAKLPGVVFEKYVWHCSLPLTETIFHLPVCPYCCKIRTETKKSPS